MDISRLLFASHEEVFYASLANDSASIRGSLGGDPECRARITTPFILERANPPRGGDAKRQDWWIIPPVGCSAEGVDPWRKPPSIPRLTATGGRTESC